MKKAESIRILFFLSAVFMFFGLVGYRLFILGYKKHAVYSQTAQGQAEHAANVLSRGSIYLSDKDGMPVLAAANKKFPVLRIDPGRIRQADIPVLADQLGQITGISSDTLKSTLIDNNKGARIINQRLNDQQVRAISDLSANGINIAYITDRFYPLQSTAADTIGFLGYAGNERSGQYGVESYYNDILSGSKNNTAGILPSKLFSSLINRSGNSQTQDAPKDIVLTIDKNVQTFVESTLDGTLRKWDSEAGSIIVQNPMTGEIIAMADRPTFDPNTYGSSDQQNFLNSTAQAIFEPGSSFKTITMAAALDLGAITPQTTYTDTGSVEIAGHTIRNFDGKAHGLQTMTQVLEHSLNTGVMFVEDKIGGDNFVNYVINMGFGQRTGIDLPGELNGDIVNLYSGRKINYLTASFGQGIAVTAIQLINAYSAVANGGRLMRPYIVKKIITQGGDAVVTKPEIVGTPITSRTAQILTSMLVSVVDNGFDKARIPGYYIAGKTGTAQIPDKQGGYIPDQYIHNFIGFAPAYNPKFVILIKMDKPKGITFAADSLSPVFRDIAAFLLNYYNIPPTR